MTEWTFAAIVLSGPCIRAAIRRQRQPLVSLLPGLLAVLFAVVDLPPAVELVIFLSLTIGLTLTALVARRGSRLAYLANDKDGVARHGRAGFLLTGDPQYLTLVDTAAWRAVARTDHAAARPLLERAANRKTWTQPLPKLLLAAAYGGADVTGLAARAEASMAKASRKARPLLLHLAIAQLVQAGHTNDALAMLSRAAPRDLTEMIRPLILVELAAATGDLDTLEALLARDIPFLDPERPELCRATAEWARGLVDQGNRRLHSIDVPPAGRAARSIAIRLANPTPLFDEALLDPEARNGLARYRELAHATLAGGR